MNREEQAKRLLYALNEVDDRYILAVCEDMTSEYEMPVQEKRPGRRPVMRWALAAAACLAVVLAGRSVFTATDSPAADEYVQEGSPIQEVSTLAEAAALTGFGMKAPEAQTPYTKTVVSVLDGTTIEVSYQTEDGAEEGYAIRKAQGTEDISGDYEVYDRTETVTVGEYEVTVKGGGTTVSVATWTDGAYTYAVCAQNHPLSLEEMTAIIAAVA